MGSGPSGTPVQASAPEAGEPAHKAAGGRHHRGSAESHLTPAPPVSAAGSHANEITSTSTDLDSMSPATVASAESAASIYSSGDLTVTPPVLVRPLLPAEPPPGLPPEQVGTIELLVDENGNVDQVKLVSPANRYEERMLVSHAKSWKFRPALKDGRPVKYRTRVRLTI
jgi:hypothetical protein